jgi:hypothetical protein
MAMAGGERPFSDGLRARATQPSRSGCSLSADMSHVRDSAEITTEGASLPRLIPVKERETMEMMSITETHTSSSESSQRCDLHVRTRLLIRRFGVRVPGGPPTSDPLHRVRSRNRHAVRRITRSPARTVRATSKSPTTSGASGWSFRPAKDADRVRVRRPGGLLPGPGYFTLRAQDQANQLRPRRESPRTLRYAESSRAKNDR